MASEITIESSSSTRLADGNSSLLDEGGSTSWVPQAAVQLAGYGSVVWPDSLSEYLVGGRGPRDGGGGGGEVVVLWEGRIAADVLLSDCQYRKGAALYDRCGV